MFRGSLSVTAAILLQLMTGASGGLSAGVVADMMKFAQAAKALWKFDRILVLSDSNSDLNLDPFLPANDTFSSLQLVHNSELHTALKHHSVLSSTNNLVLSLTDLTPTELKNLSAQGYLETAEWHIPDSPTFPSDLNLRLDSRLYVYKRNSTGSQIDLFEIYAIKGSAPKMSFVGQWLPPSGGVNSSINGRLTVSQPNVFERRQDLSGVTLRNCVLPWAPISYLIDNPDGTLSTTGLFMNVLTNLQQNMKFTIEAVRPADGLWGGLLDNGSYTGIVGTIQRKENDISTGGLSISLERSFAIDYTVPLTSNKVGIIMRDSGGKAVNYWVFIDVFLGLLWFGIMLVMTGLTVGFCVIRYYGGEKLHPQSDSESFGVLNSFSLVSLVYLQKDYGIEKNSVATKILYFSTCISSFIVFAYYTAVLTAEMTAQDPPAPIRNFDDVLSNNYKLYYWKDTTIELYLQKIPSDKSGNQLYQRGINEGWGGGLSELKDIVDTVQGQDDAAFFGFFLTFFGQPNTKHVVIEESMEQDGAIVLQKNSEFTKFFNYHISKQLTTGLMSKNERTWLPSTTASHTDHAAEEVTALAYDNLFFPFACLIAGVVFSAIGFGIERAMQTPRIREWFNRNLWRRGSALLDSTKSVFRKRRMDSREPLFVKSSGGGGRGQAMPQQDSAYTKSQKMYAFDEIFSARGVNRSKLSRRK